MKNKGQLIVGILGVALLGLGGWFLYSTHQASTNGTDNSGNSGDDTDSNGGTSSDGEHVDMPNDSDSTSYSTPTSVRTNTSSAPVIHTVSNPPPTLSTVSTATVPSVYANASGVNMNLTAVGSGANPIVLGAVYRTSNAKGELLGTFIKNVTIYDILFVEFKDRYSGVSGLIPYNVVTIKY